MTGQVAASAARPRHRGARGVLSALSRPRVAVMLALGFSSGLPFMLIGNTLGLWLDEAGVGLALIGFLSWISLTYSVKFLWGAVVDRLPAPLFNRLGRRRGWMLLTQAGVGIGLLGMAASDPTKSLPALIAFGLVAGVSAAAQDTVIDAWRIEIAADGEELGLLTSAYSLGYRGALVATEALILLLAQAVGWPLAYALYGLFMGVGMVAALFAGEPPAADAAIDARAKAETGAPLRSLADAVTGPFIAFMREHGLALGVLMLGMITLYHLSDYMRGPMSLPFYRALGIDKPTIVAVRTTVGLAGSLIGVALGGLSTLRLGVMRSLIVGGILQPIAVGAFALLALHGGDYVLMSLGPVKVTAFAAIMSFDSAAMGYAGVALVTYMSGLTSLGYTATQYALLTSALTWTGKTLKGFSGVLVVGLTTPGRSLIEAYGLFYLLAAALGLPAIALAVWLALTPRARIGAAEA
ncbi:MAG: MFS transporter [Alphaproteobacteria bacterium]|nr:MFS transporter [Alphaproteobacteria bacterium]